jgi:hypothetical protein
MMREIAEEAKGPVLREYRGYQIRQDGPTDFAILRCGSEFVRTRCGSSWSCICYIDGLLSP